MAPVPYRARHLFTRSNSLAFTPFSLVSKLNLDPLLVHTSFTCTKRGLVGGGQVESFLTSASSSRGADGDGCLAVRAVRASWWARRSRNGCLAVRAVRAWWWACRLQFTTKIANKIAPQGTPTAITIFWREGRLSSTSVSWPELPGAPVPEKPGKNFKDNDLLWSLRNKKHDYIIYRSPTIPSVLTKSPDSNFFL